MTTLTDAGFSQEWDSLSAAISGATTANEKKIQAGAALKTLKQMARGGKLTRFQHLNAAVAVVELVPVDARKSIITAVYNESRQCGSHPIITYFEMLEILTRLSDATRHVKQAPTGPTRTALLLAASLYEAGDCTSTDWKKATHAILDSRNTGVDATLLDVLSAIDRQLPDNAMGVKETLNFKAMVINHIADQDLRSSQTVLLHTKMHDAYRKRKLTLDDYLSAAQNLPYGCNAAAIDAIVFNAQRVAIDAYKNGNYSLNQSLQVQNNLTHHLEDPSRFNRVTLNFLDSGLSNRRLTLGTYLQGVVTAFDGLSTEVRAEIAPQFMERTGQYILSGSPEGTEIYLRDQRAMLSHAQRNDSAFSAQIAAYPYHLRESAVDQAWSYIEQAQEANLLSSENVIACQRSLLWRRQGDQSCSMHRPHLVAAPVLNMFNQAAVVIANAVRTQVFSNRQALDCLSSLLSYEAWDDEKLFTYKVPIIGYETLVDAAVPVMAGLVNSGTVREAFNFITEHDASPDTLARHGIFVYDGPANVLGGKRDNGGLKKMRLCALFKGMREQDPVLILHKEKTPFLVFPLSTIKNQKFTQGERSVVNAVLEQAKLQPQY